MATGLIAGIVMYYLQVYGFYDRLPETAGEELTLTNLATGAPEPMLVEAFEGIDASSSPLRYRACFTTPMSVAMLTETFVTYDAPEPLVAPGWFSCFDAGRIGADLENGTAFAFLSRAEIHDGVDRVIAVYEDGRAFAWHQLNEKFRD
ncbi:DUF6446 family protein [Pseudoruegeria aquimaris]|uniref:DUF6446 family protein n=1 Tax=Pseudoruegeria aquimaris TaxID=393663 RepID=UPI0027958123|nr:DUF6446 family protein [Pseudoruegeria aquimaris]